MKYAQERATSVSGSIDDFRNLVNDLHRLIETLLGDKRKWYILCSAMDAIDHTESAIKSYEDSIDIKDLGNIYLSIYGLFQALVIQQDALFEIYKVLEVTRTDNPILSTIRDLRNDSSGHPVNRSHRVTARSNFFYSMEWDKESFTLNRAYHDGTPNDFLEVKPLELISLQRIEINSGLVQLIQVLKDRENTHRASYRGVDMEDFFNGYRYCFEKIFTHLLPSDMTTFSIAKISFIELQENIKKFTDELETRGIRHSLPGVVTTLDEILHPMKRLNEYFVENSEIDKKDVLSFARHFEVLVDEIIVMAKEIDYDYKDEI